MADRASTRRHVYRSLLEIGFGEEDINAAIAKFGYDLERCTEYLVQSKPQKQRLEIGMEVWIYSQDDHDWVPGNIVAINKYLVSIIFNGHDFRWVEKESDLWSTARDKPAPLMGDDDDMSSESQDMPGPAPPNADEFDYMVLFPESVLGLELYSDEDGFNCIVGRCVSQIARDRVTPGSQIIQVNGRWLADYRFEEIRDAVKQAAKNPPLEVKFRIRRSLVRKPQQSNGHLGVENKPGFDKVASGYSPQRSPEVSPMNSASNPQAMPSYSRSPQPVYYDGAGNPSDARPAGNSQAVSQLFPEKSPMFNSSASMEEEKQARPNQTFVQHMSFEQAQLLRPGDHIDHRDDVGRFLLAVIVDKQRTRLKIHYEGWNSKWDVYSDYSTELHRFAAPKSISRQKNNRMLDVKVRDYIDICPTLRHKGWRVGQIRRMDRYSGQVQVVYKEEGAEFLYWAHLNNPEETAPFMTRAEESLQRHMQEQQDKQELMRQNSKSSSRRKQLPPALMGKKLPPKPPARGYSRDNVGGSGSRWISEPQKRVMHQQSDQYDVMDWNCPMCRKDNPSHYSVCQNCGASFQVVRS